jgi:hypothetical protein
MRNPASPKAAPAKPPRPTRPDYPHQTRPTPALCSRRGCYAGLDTSSSADSDDGEWVAASLWLSRAVIGPSRGKCVRAEEMSATIESHALRRRATRAVASWVREGRQGRMAGRGEGPSNIALEQPAGSHALAAAAQRDR